MVGGVDAIPGQLSGVITLSLSSLNRVLRIDPISQTATVEAGIFGPELEAALKKEGFTLGHFPQSFEFSTLGGWIATRSSGQNSLGYGGIEKMVVSLKMVTADSTTETITVPRYAIGPDFKEILLGSEGTFGVITSATVRLYPVAQEKEYFLIGFRSFVEASEAARAIIQEGNSAAMLRVFDEEETAGMFLFGRHSKGIIKKIFKPILSGFLKWRGFYPSSLSGMLIGLEGTKDQVEAERILITDVLQKFSSIHLGSSPGESWLKDRFFLPYLRDDFLDNSLFIDTLETSTEWSNLHALYRAVKEAIKKEFDRDSLPCKIFIHVSHLYRDGASLYFTILGKQTKDPFDQWNRIKKAASDAIILNGGVISHHHGIGIDHKNYTPWNEFDGELLKKIKSQFDPNGIMNPGKLFKY